MLPWSAAEKGHLTSCDDQLRYRNTTCGGNKTQSRTCYQMLLRLGKCVSTKLENTSHESTKNCRASKKNKKKRKEGRKRKSGFWRNWSPQISLAPVLDSYHHKLQEVQSHSVQISALTLSWTIQKAVCRKTTIKKWTPDGLTWQYREASESGRWPLNTLKRSLIYNLLFNCLSLLFLLLQMIEESM